MRDPSDVRLVDAHAKRNRGNDNQPVFLLKTPLGNAAVFGFHTAMVMQGNMPLIPQGLGQPFSFGTCPAINNARLALAPCREIQNLRTWGIFSRKCQMDIGAIKTPQKCTRGRAVEQLLYDLDLGLSISRRRECRQGHIQCPAQFPDAQIVRAEIMTPLADAMRLIYRDH